MAAIKEYSVAVAGATGAVGNEMIKTLEQRNFPVGELGSWPARGRRERSYLFAGREVTVQTHDERLV